LQKQASNLEQKPKTDNLTENQAQHGFARKFNKKAGIRDIRRNKPKMSKFSQKHAQIALSSKLKLQKYHQIKKSNLQNAKIGKKQANFK